MEVEDDDTGVPRTPGNMIIDIDDDDDDIVPEVDEGPSEKDVVGPLATTTAAAVKERKRAQSRESVERRDVFSIQMQSIYNTFYFRFAELELHPSISEVGMLSRAMQPYEDMDSLYTDLYKRFLLTYKDSSSTKSRGPLSALKLALDCPDLFMLCALMFISDWARVSREGGHNSMEPSLLQYLVDTRRTQGGPSGTPPYEAIQQTLTSLTLNKLRDDMALYDRLTLRRKDYFVRRPDSLQRLYQRLLDISGHDTKKSNGVANGVVPLASLMALAAVKINDEPRVRLSIERLTRENGAIDFYASAPLYDKYMYDMQETHSVLLASYAAFGSLIDRYILSAEATFRPVTLGDLDALFYAITAPLYHRQESSLSFIFRMARDFCFLLREQHRRQGNIVQYVRLLDELARQPSLGRNGDRERAKRVSDSEQFLALGAGAFRLDTPLYEYLASFERYKAPLYRHYRITGPLIESIVASLVTSMWKQQHDFRGEYVALQDPLPLLEKEALSRCIEHRMKWFQRLITQQTYLFHAVREVLYPRLVEAIWGLLLQQVRSALDLNDGDGHCCSPRDTRILRRVLLETDTTRLWYTDQHAPRGAPVWRHKRLRLPWLDRRLFDRYFVEVSDESRGIEDRIRLPDPDQTQYEVEYTEAELSDHVKRVVRTQMGHLRRQMHFMYNAFFQDVGMTGGLNPSRSHNPVYRCLQQVVQQMQGPLAPFASDLYDALGCYCALEFQNAMGVDTRAYDAAYFYMKLCRPASLHADPAVTSRAVCDDMRLLELLENNEQLFAFKQDLFTRDSTGLNITALRRTSVQWLCDEIKRRLATAPGSFTQRQLYTLLKSYNQRSRTTVSDAGGLAEFIGHAAVMYLPETYTQLLYVEPNNNNARQQKPRTLGQLKSALGLPGGNQAVRPPEGSGGGSMRQTEVPMNILMILRVYDPSDAQPRYYILNDTTLKDRIALDALDVQGNLFIVAVPQDAAQTSVSVSVAAQPPKQRRATQQQQQQQQEVAKNAYAVIELRDSVATVNARLFPLDLSDLAPEQTVPADVLSRCISDSAGIDELDYPTLVSSGSYRVTEFVSSRMSDNNGEDKLLYLITLVPTRAEHAWNANELSVAQYCGVCYAVVDYLLHQAPLVITAENYAGDTEAAAAAATTGKGRKRAAKSRRGVVLVPTEAVQRQMAAEQARAAPKGQEELQRDHLQTIYMPLKRGGLETRPLAEYAALGLRVATEFFMRAKTLIDEGKKPSVRDYYTDAQLKGMENAVFNDKLLGTDESLTLFLGRLASKLAVVDKVPQIFTAAEQADIDYVREEMAIDTPGSDVMALTLKAVRDAAKQSRYGEYYQVFTLEQTDYVNTIDPENLTILSSDTIHQATRKRYLQHWLAAAGNDRKRNELVNTLDKYVRVRDEAAAMLRIAQETQDNRAVPDIQIDGEEGEEEEAEVAGTDNEGMESLLGAINEIVPEYTPSENQIGADADQAYTVYPQEDASELFIDGNDGGLYYYDNNTGDVDMWRQGDANGQLLDLDGNPIVFESEETAWYY